MIKISYTKWALRGANYPVFQVYVEITDSHDISQLLEVKEKLNNAPVKGIVLAENKSVALKRLGWKELDSGVWFKIFV